eukprot:4626147-Amphidinium_carterae.1
MSTMNGINPREMLCSIDCTQQMPEGALEIHAGKPDGLQPTNHPVVQPVDRSDLRIDCTRGSLCGGGVLHLRHVTVGMIMAHFLYWWFAWLGCVVQCNIAIDSHSGHGRTASSKRQPTIDTYMIPHSTGVYILVCGETAYFSMSSNRDDDDDADVTVNVWYLTWEDCVSDAVSTWFA